jgi:hypothetical protein
VLVCSVQSVIRVQNGKKSKCIRYVTKTNIRQKKKRG